MSLCLQIIVLEIERKRGNVMTVSKTNASDEKKEQKNEKLKVIVPLIYRTLNSLVIPFSVAVIFALIGTFILKSNDAGFFFNLVNYFCKSFFPCLPLMMIYIGKK